MNIGPMRNSSLIKHRNKGSRYILLKLYIMIIVVLSITGFSGNIIKAQAAIKLYNYASKTTTTYSDKQIKVTLNGTSIGSNVTPGILVNGVALLPYDDIFQNSNIAAECSYNSSQGTITITKYNKKIVMTIGSKTATVNGKKSVLSVAPMKIKYLTSGDIKIMVPSRFISEALGLGYTWNSIKSTVAIKKNTMLLSYNGQDKFEYSGTQGKVTIDGATVNLGSMPSIIISNTAMLQAKTVFADSKIKATYVYSSSDQSITITKGNNKLAMTIGSKTAYLNGQKKTLSAAPVQVTNYENNNTYVMVPGSFTATSLGYGYTWNNSTRTSVITTSNPELGDSGDLTETGTILQEWDAVPALIGSTSGVKELNSDGTPTNQYGTIYNVTRDTTNIRQNCETFMITSTAPFNKLTSNNSGNEITILSDNQICNSQNYPMAGISNFVQSINLSNHTDTIGTSIVLNALQSNYQYDLSLSSDHLTLYVTVYYNTLTSAIVGTNTSCDYITLTGILPLGATVTNNSGNIIIDIPNTINTLGDLTKSFTGSKFISQITSVNSVDRTQLKLTLKNDYKYYSEESGNKFTIIFQPKSEIIDKNDYQIVIPKPTNVTSTMISDEDYYYKNYFTITLKGDLTDYLNNNPISNTAASVRNISVSLNSSGNTNIKIATTKLQGYLISTDSNYIYVKVGNPRNIYKNIVVLDPGHGGGATGAIQSGTNEKDINFKILYTVGKKYFNQDPSKLKVYYTRTSDVDLSLKDRAAFASKVGADLFVSLHMNTVANSSSARGTEVYYSDNNNSTNKAGLTSKNLAGMILQNLYPAVGTSSRGVRQAHFTVIDRNTVPAVLIELGFLSNKSDFTIIMDENKQNIAAQSIYNTLLQVLQKYPTRR